MTPLVWWKRRRSARPENAASGRRDVGRAHLKFRGAAAEIIEKRHRVWIVEAP